MMSPDIINKIGVIVETITVILGAGLVAFWIGFVFWTFNDIRARTTDWLTIILATLLVLVTGPIGILLYLLLRPKFTLIELYDRQLEEEVLSRELELHPVCPSCHKPVEPDWLFCPYCHTQLKKQCVSCGKPLERDWDICPYCGAPQPVAETAVEEAADIPAVQEAQVESTEAAATSQTS
jgi:RNA polymerase subunit RPABC4/transcription elongation factor Spt4